MRSLAARTAGVRTSLEKRLRTIRRQARLQAIASSRKPVVLFLSPEAGLKPFFASHLILARTLAQSGGAGLVLSCDGYLPICTVKFAMRMDPTAPGDINNQACRRCRAIAAEEMNRNGVLDLALETVLTDADRQRIAAVMSKVAEKPWLADLDNISFGELCLTEVLRDQRKRSVSELSVKDVALLTALLHSSLAVYLALKGLTAQFNVTQIAYFGEYAYWIPPQILAARRAIRLIAVSHAYNRDIDRRQISVRPRHYMVHMLEQVDRWEAYRDRPLPANVITTIAESALYRLKGATGITTYSPGWTSDNRHVLEELGLSSQRRTVIAYPSSYDEFVCADAQLRALGVPYASQPQPFANQDEWLSELLNWVAPRSDLQLVVRLHPRLGVNNRFVGLSSEYDNMKKLFAAAPANVAVVWPESPVSSYSLAEFADVALISWSSMGLELARFGVPVVSAFKRIGQFPVGRFIKFGDTPERYFAAIEAGLDAPGDRALILEAFRWTHYLHMAHLIDVSDMIPKPDFEDIPSHRAPANREMMLRLLVDGADVTAANMDALPRTRTAHVGEDAAIRAELERFILFLMTGQDAKYPMRAVFAGDEIRAHTSEEPVLYLGPHDEVALAGRDGVHRRTSRLVYRLGQALACGNAGAAHVA